jgi:disulfide oxidoreductase YuzD
MVYYDLVKEKQANHKGSFAEAIRKLIFPEVVLFEEKIEDRTILRDEENGKPRNWGTKREWRDYMMSKGYNTHNTKMKYVDHSNLPKDLLTALNTLPIKYPVFSLNIQPPGGMVPAHEDTWRIWYDKHPKLAKKYTFEDTAFFLVFLTPQEIGHSFQCGTTNIKWGPGDVIEMPYYCRHATANAGYTNKMLVQCLGIKK